MSASYALFDGAWSGDRGTAPAAAKLAAMAANAAPESVRSAALQLCNNGDARSLPQLLSVLACALWRPQGRPDPRLMAALPQANAQVCGYVFNRNDIVWTCRTCASDPTCCQCDACFRQSDHTGHEVYFHRAGGNGGCCDCGDAEAWNADGACPRHKDTTELNDPLSVVPLELQQGLELVATAVIEFLLDHLVQTVRAYDDWDKNVHIATHLQTNCKMVFQLHNDDVHTYDEVMSALRDLNISNTAPLTRAVDKEGQATLVETDVTETLRQHWARCTSLSPSLLVSMMPVELYSREASCRAICVWLNTIGKLNDGIRRYVTRLLIGPNIPVPVMNDAVFPAAVPRLREEDGEVARPLTYAPMTPATVLLLAHPFMNKQTRDSVNDLLLTFILDNEFKVAFSELMGILYPPLYLLFCRAVGTSEDTIFHTTVQVYTAPSVIDMMSTDGASTRMLRQPGTPVSLTIALLQALRRALQEAGFGQGDDTAPLEHHILVFRRTFQICHDLGYVMEPHNHAVRVAAGRRDQGALEEWVRILSLLQGCDTHRRKVGAHVEYETNHWLHGANLLLGVVNVGASFLTAALAPEHQAVKPTDVDEQMRVAAAQTLLRSAVEALAQWGRSENKHPLQVPAPWSPTATFWSFLIARVSSPQGEGVSIHIPLHRYVAQIIHKTMSGGVNVDVFQLLKDDILPGLTLNAAQFGALLMEQPLRCLSWTAQVHAGMWRRNGDSVASLIMNYVRVPLSFGLYDMDIAALQCGCTLAGPDQLLGQLFDQFEVLNFATGEATHGVLSCLADALQVLIQVVTELPPHPLGIGADAEQPGSPFEQLICREVVHKLCIESQSTSTLLRQKLQMPRTVSEGFLHTCIQKVSDNREGPHGESVRELKPEFFDWFDPEFRHLSTQELQAATERVIAHRKQKKSSGNKHRPVVSMVPSSHPSFQCVRSLLYRPAFLRSLQAILAALLTAENRTANISWEAGAHHQVLGRIVHLVTLQLLCFDEIRVLNLQDDAFDGVSQYFANVIASSDDRPSLLAQLVSLHTSSELGDDFYSAGLTWCLKELAHRDRSCKEKLLAFGIEFSDGKRSASDDMERRKKRAQKKALQALNKQAVSFQMQFEDEEEDEGDDSESVSTAADFGVETGADVCILCHERSANPIGYFACAQRSQLLERSIDNSRRLDAFGYRVAALGGAKVYRAANPESTELAHLEQGTIVTVLKRVQHWAKVRVSSAMETSVPAEDIVGWCYVFDPASGHCVLTPLKPLQWRRFGGARPYVTSCCHTAHFKCWEKYRQSARQINHPYMVCPLCKSVSNVLVPHTPPLLREMTFFQAEENTATLDLFGSADFNPQEYFQRVFNSARTAGDALQRCHSEYAQMSAQWMVMGFRWSVTGVVGESSTSRALRTLWAAVAYKLQCAELNSRMLSYETQTSVEDTNLAEPWAQSSLHSDAMLTEHMFQSCRVETLSGSDELSLATSLAALFAGDFKEQMCTEPFGIHKLDALNSKQLVQALMHLPSQVVPLANYPDHRAQNHLRLYADQSNVPSQLVHSLFTTPLIANDLATIAVAATAHASSEKAALELLSLCCMARLVQILFEPFVIGVASPPQSVSGDLSTAAWMSVDALEDLQQTLYRVSGVPIIRSVLRGTELLRVVAASWVPFLRFAALLQRIITRDHSFLAPLPQANAQALRTALGVADPESWLSTPTIAALLQAWAEHYRNFFVTHVLDSDQLNALVSHHESSGDIPTTREDVCVIEENAVITGLSSSDQTPRHDLSDDDYSDEDGGAAVQAQGGFPETAFDIDAADIGAEQGWPVGEEDDEASEDIDDVDESGEEDDAEGMEGHESDEDEIVLELPEGADLDSFEVGHNLPGLLEALQSGDLSSLLRMGRRPTGWSLFGVDPEFSTIDECEAEFSRFGIAHTIYPFVGSISGVHTVYGFAGDKLARPFADVSHLGVNLADRSGLIELPTAFTEVYQKAKYPNGEHLPPVDDPALCLLCGAVLNAGNKNSPNTPGECTLHTKTCNGGVGIFLLVQRAATLLICDSASCIFSSVYVDEYGEPDVGLKRGKPLMLSTSRYRKLVSIYRQHLIPREIIAQRLNSDTVLRDDWF